jgi:hypothetical protein
MATQKVTPFSRPKQEPYFAETISQTELALLTSLRARKRILDAEIHEAEESLERRLEAGTPVEPGQYIAKLQESWRKSISWKGVLIQFARSLGIDGEKYCQAVLDKAEPTGERENGQ